MTRRAILIGSANPPNSNPLPGAEVDVVQMGAFLKSKVGGAWSDQEISTLIDPTQAEVLGALILPAQTEYAFIACSGHGSHPRGQSKLNTRILLHDGPMRIRDLHPDVDKCTIMVDVCRTVVDVAEEAQHYITEHTKIASKLPDRALYRRAFYATLDRCNPSITYMFSCDIGETAGEHPKLGGLFTRSIISQAIEWEANQQGWNRTQSMIEGFMRARGHVRATSDQNPTFERDVAGTRHFPLAVSLT